MTNYDPASRSRLGSFDLRHFPEPTLFHSVARVLCEVGCVPRKELFESWEVARGTRRHLRGARVVDLACGHGLVANLLLLLDPTLQGAVAVDKRIPESAEKVRAVLAARWPRLSGRVELVEGRLTEVEVRPADLVVSCHACGPLTDRVLDRAIEALAPVAVLPCCHAMASGDAGGLEGWMDNALAVDVTRAARLRSHGYKVHTRLIPEAITPKNRLLLGSRPVVTHGRGGSPDSG